VAILMQVWLYATPIMYPLSIVAEAKPGLVPLYRANPMERFTEVFRNTIYDGRWPTLADTTFVVVVSLVAVLVGYAVFKRYEGRLAEEL